MNIQPITKSAPACFGVLCERHAQCSRYHAVNGAPASLPRIGHCEPDEHSPRPLFVPIKELQ